MYFIVTVLPILAYIKIMAILVGKWRTVQLLYTVHCTVLVRLADTEDVK
jgi:hypothetical protein